MPVIIITTTTMTVTITITIIIYSLRPPWIVGTVLIKIGECFPDRPKIMVI